MKVPASLSALGLAGLCALALWPGGAMGAGYQIRENSAKLLGRAFAGAGSTADDLSTIFWNPAGMSELEGYQVGAAGSVILPRAEFSGGATSALGAPISGGDGGNAAQPDFVPALYATGEIAPDLRLGLAVTTPFGLRTDYSDGWQGRYQALKSALTTYDINPSIAYRIADWLSVGAGVSAQYADADLTNALNSTSIALAAGLSPSVALGLPDGRFEASGDDWSIGWNAGLLVEPRQGTRIGLSYRSKVDHKLDGRVRIDAPAPLSASPALRDSGASADLTTPETVLLSAYQEITPQVAVMADIAWTNWSRFQDLTVKRDDGAVVSTVDENWQDSWFFSLGSSYKPDERWTFRTGVAYDQSPVKDRFRTARIPDQDRLWLAAGASYSYDAWLTADLGYAHIFVKDSSIDELSATGDRLVGSYDNGIDILALSATLRF